MIPAPPQGSVPIQGLPHVGIPYRVGAYHGGQTSHLVSRTHPDIFYCGRSIGPSSPREDWWAIQDQRGNPKICGECKDGDRKEFKMELAREKDRSLASDELYDAECHPDEIMDYARKWFPAWVDNPFL